MNRKLKTLIILAIMIYAYIADITSFKIANIAIVIFACIVVICHFYHPENDKQEIPNSINSVPKELVHNKNTLSNKYCIARFFQNTKIIVMDNPALKKQTLRLFTVDKTNCQNINSCWEQICSIFDSYTYLDTLFSYIDKNSGSIDIKYINKETKPSNLKDVKDLIPKDTFKEKEIPKIEINDDSPLSKKIKQSEEQNTPIVIEFEDLKQNKPAEEKQNTENSKIDINNANAETISYLPGINIVMAKKIVEYRNLNGVFADKEEFFKISGAKEHFKNGIFDMIILRTEEKKQNSESEGGRTVD